MIKLILTVLMLLLLCGSAWAGESSEVKPVLVAFNFDFRFDWSPPRKKVITEEPPYYLLVAGTTNYLTTPTGDKITHVHK